MLLRSETKGRISGWRSGVSRRSLIVYRQGLTNEIAQHNPTSMISAQKTKGTLDCQEIHGVNTGLLIVFMHWLFFSGNSWSKFPVINSVDVFLIIFIKEIHGVNIGLLTMLMY